MTKVFTRNGVELKWKYAINNQRQHKIVLTLNQSTLNNSSNSSMKQYIKLAHTCIEHHGIKTVVFRDTSKRKVLLGVPHYPLREDSNCVVPFG